MRPRRRIVMTRPTLWSRNFTILTVGTVVSTIGSSLSGFAISLLALDFSGSVFLYTLFMVAYTLPKVVLPLISGPIFDKRSRRKAIYTLDFISSGIYLLLYFIIVYKGFTYPLFIVAALVIGSIDSTYSVAYESLYPNIVPDGFYRKAYSISSVIQTFAAIMVPVSVYIYETVGIAPLFLYNAISFFIAAIMETRIKVDEKHTASNDTKENFISRFRGGVNYLKKERGLMFITIYFAITMFATSGSSTITLPYFRNGGPGIVAYLVVMGCGIAGRFVGSIFQYNHRYGINRRFNISVIAYMVISVFTAVYLYLPILPMALMSFVIGTMNSTSYNLRVSATQDYVPDTVRARFNGTFLMFCTFGSVSGQLAAGALADWLPIRTIITAFYCIDFAAIVLIMLLHSKHIKPVYNRAV